MMKQEGVQVQMSGPALRQIHSHHAIHESAHQEAMELTLLLDHALEHKDLKVGLEIANLLVEHWETRTLRHAQAEEEGLYKEVITSDPEKEAIVHGLTRDHELMRLAFQEIRVLLQSFQLTPDISMRFHLMLWLENQHSRDEEKRLISSLMNLR